MARELVILTEREATLEEWTSCAADILGAGLVRSYASGVSHLLRPDGEGLVAFWPARPLEVRREAIGMIGDAADHGSLWIDVSLPAGSHDSGMRIATEMAARLGGRLVAVTQ
ncbi:MAG: hypothetical protein ACK5KO_11720 [Arachnia sp.]